MKSILAAALLSMAATAAVAQQAQPQTPARPATAQPAAPAQPAARATTPANQNTLVNLNTATKDQLDSLPQIGDARAQAIIAKRPYRDWNDFVSKNVIPGNAEAAIKDKVRFR